MKDERLFHQWTKVLRFEVGREVALFNDQKEERLYRIVKFGDDAVHVNLITELVPKVPEKEIYLCFSLLKKDKNDWVLQKGTELGVRHFIPLLTDRTEKMSFDIDRAEKIVIEASEQCGRSDIPSIREPLRVATLIEELQGASLLQGGTLSSKQVVDLLVAEQGRPLKSQTLSLKPQNAVGVLIGPEGGWSDSEKQLFKDKNLEHLALSEFTLRAETAAIIAATLLQ